ncbi:MAG: 4Fe-4S binding protein [Bacteroidales bacterium]|nr:4Fe-4S binding protein [Bacteroidales bacterium]
MLRKIRITLGAIFIICVTALFLDFTGVAHQYLGWMAKMQLIPAVLSVNLVVLAILAVLTLLFGRLYCSVICPLGVTQDIISWIAGKRKKNRFSYSPAKTILRYVLMAVYVVACLVGLDIIMTLLDPYAAFGRIINSMVQPIYELCNNVMAKIAEHYDSYMFYEVDVWVKSVAVLVIAAVTLVGVGILAWRNGRTYCNTICPVGSLLGLISKVSLFKVTIDTTKCNGCTLCQRNCKASCINAKAHEIDYSRCVVCGDCIEKCNRGAISYKLRAGKQAAEAKGSEEKVDDSKRAFAMTAGLMVATSVASKAQEKIKMDGGLAVILDKEEPKRETKIVPAGATSIDSFSDHCVGCQLCVSACPNGVLRSALMQPEMSYEYGYCRPECTRCSEVCPAGAIVKITKAEKSSIQIGHAVWVKKNCVVLTDDVECGNCARHCPSGAISMVASDASDPKSKKIPVVNEERCIGCGACENLCPARPFSAIYVEGHEVHKTI